MYSVKYLSISIIHLVPITGLKNGDVSVFLPSLSSVDTRITVCQAVNEKQFVKMFGLSVLRIMIIIKYLTIISIE